MASPITAVTIHQTSELPDDSGIHEASESPARLTSVHAQLSQSSDPLNAVTTTALKPRARAPRSIPTSNPLKAEAMTVGRAEAGVVAHFAFNASLSCPAMCWM